jgi:hypothetical protein
MSENKYIVTPVSSLTFDAQTINAQDNNLLNQVTIDGLFSPTSSIVEFSVYNLNKDLLAYESDLTSWVINDGAQKQNLLTSLTLNPQDDLTNYGFGYGKSYAVYNFIENELGSSANNLYFISEISSDRTEIRIDNTNISNQSLEILYDSFSQKFNSPETYDYFYLNFLENKLLIATNVYLDKSSSDYSILIKLYEPLPQNYAIKDQCFVCFKIADSVAYSVEFQTDFGDVDNIIKLQGPNINLNISNQVNNSTSYQTYNTLTNSTNSSSYYQLQSLLEEKGVDINVDYTDYSNFVFYSSANSRLSNFYYKAKQIEDYNSEIYVLTTLSVTSGSSGSINLIQQYISDIITNFDGYEYYLYYNSGSKAWPKTNSTPPYTLASTGSLAVLSWYGSDVYGSTYYGGQLYSASLYDSQNQELLTNTLPDYLNNYNSDQYLTFVKMIGQMFDNVWVYIKSVSDKTNTDNRLEYGASSGIIADVLRSLGINIYTNNFSVDNTYQSLLGFGSNGALYPTGSELINTLITASTIPITLDDVNSLTYKRLYHNLPYLLKKKGTPEGLKTLFDLYGIPDTVLRINEFGGKDKNYNTFDFWQDEYNFAFKTTGSSKVSIPFTASSANFGTVFPGALEFRFQTFGLPTTSIPYSQSIVNHNVGTFNIVLEYTGSGYTSGSYNGSIKDPYYQYATLKFISGSLSASVYLPFYNGDWWSVLVNANSSSNTYTLYAKNKIDDLNILGFQASSSFTGTSFWNTGGQLIFGTSSINNSKTYSSLSGSYQEIRYYNVPLSESAFNAYVMNPNSVEGNMVSGSQSSYNSLFFRLALGGESYTGSNSIHPSSTGSTITNPFIVNPQTGSYSGSYSFVTNIETFYYDQVPAGIQNIVTNNIQTVNTLLPYSSSNESNAPNSKTLSPFISIQQNFPISSSYTKNINYTEVAFSPQNEINEDIMSTLGYFNIGDYIGDPRQVGLNDVSYADLDAVRNDYFNKYYSNYNWNDYLRLIKYFDNSLFSLVKDFIPARTSLASGVVIKQHLLERNKYPVPQPTASEEDYTGSITMYHITGSDGGTFLVFSSSLYSFLTQSWNGYNNNSLSGSIPFSQSDSSEFYNGELSGSYIRVASQSLNSNNNYLTQSNPDASSFALSNYNVLVNNVTQSVLSSFFMDVDYTSNQTIPVNQQLLLSGSANKFEIPDSNYTTLRHINPRYEGSKTTSPDFNKPIYIKPSKEFINNQYSVTTPSTQSQIPNASRYSNWFVYFDYIESAYPEVPGGGNVHCTYLVNTQGQAILLQGDNNYLEYVSNIFKAGISASILPAVYASGQKSPNVVVFDGGAKYQTIIEKSGSGDISTANFSITTDVSSIYFSSLSLITSSANTTSSTLISNSSNFLDSLLNTTSVWNGSSYETVRFYFNDNICRIFNKSQNQYNTGFISPSDTYLPIQQYDLVRIGNSTGTTPLTTLDLLFDNKLYNISNINTVNRLINPTISSSLGIIPSAFGINVTVANQTFRIFRRIPTEKNITITTFPSYTNPGFLVPDNFNPNYNPYDLAKEAGLI